MENCGKSGSFRQEFGCKLFFILSAVFHEVLILKEEAH